MLDGREFQDRTKTLQSSQSLASVGPVSMRNSFRLESGTNPPNESRATVNSKEILFPDKKYFLNPIKITCLELKMILYWKLSQDSTSMQMLYLGKSHVYGILREVQYQRRLFLNNPQLDSGRVQSSNKEIMFLERKNNLFHSPLGSCI